MSKRAIAVAALALLVGLLLWGFLRGRHERQAEAETEAPVATAERTGTVAGLPAVSLSAEEQQAAGLQVAPLAPARHAATRAAVASVVATTDLSHLRAELATARAEATAADAKAAASSAQLQRLRTLRAQEQDVSLTELQAAEATLAADRAAADAARAGADAARQSATLDWGPVLSRAVADDSAVFERLSSGRDVLLQVTLPAGDAAAAPPRMLEVDTAQGRVQARYLAPAARSDARLQGASTYYLAPAQGLRPGTSVAVALPTGAMRDGAQVPASAIVWWQGQGWAYTRHDTTRFVRRQLPAGGAIDDGWFVPSAFAGGEPVVVSGAQRLFSEELRAQLQGDAE